MNLTLDTTDTAQLTQRQRLEQHRVDAVVRGLPRSDGSGGRRVRRLRRRRSPAHARTNTARPSTPRAPSARTHDANGAVVEPGAARANAGPERRSALLLRDQVVPLLLRPRRRSRGRLLARAARPSRSRARPIACPSCLIALTQTDAFLYLPVRSFGGPMSKRLSRRTLLRGAAGVGIGLPLLEAMLPRSASGATPSAPRRIMFVFQGQRRSDQAPLHRHRRDQLHVRRIFGAARAVSQGPAAPEPARSSLRQVQVGRTRGRPPTGRRLARALEVRRGRVPDRRRGLRPIGYVLGPSADHEIGDRVLKDNPGVSTRHLVFRVNTRENNIWNVSSHAGPAGSRAR